MPAKSAKIAAPDDVPPVTVGGTRYEAVHWGKSLGFAQNGGHVRAVDVASGATLWVAEVYRIDYRPELEADKQDTFIVALQPVDGGETLIVTDDRGRRWRLDLARRVAAPDTAP